MFTELLTFLLLTVNHFEKPFGTLKKYIRPSRTVKSRYVQ
jgi:hypothetical protein